MGIRDAVIIAILLSQSLCQAGGRSLASSLLQGLLSSNPQLLKMASSKLIQQNNAAEYCPSYQQFPAAPILSNGQYLAPVFQNQKTQYNPNVIEMPYQNQVYQSAPVQVYQNSPVQVCQNTVQPVAQYQNVKPVSQTQPANVQYSTVQQTQTSYTPSKPCPFLSPAPLVNPFLPAASPISALCPPTSSLLPPANPSLARSQYLRKIPIPPPCL